MEERPKTGEGHKTASGRIVQKTASGRIVQKTAGGRVIPKTGSGRKTGPGEMPVEFPKPGFLDKLRVKVNRQLVDWLAKHAMPKTDAMVLEAGSGASEGASMLAAMPGVRLSVALDLNRHNLQLARHLDPKLIAVRGDLFHLPFKPGTFDLVWNNSTLEHIHDKRRVVYEMVRVTKDAGHVFVGLPYAHGPLSIYPWISGTKLGKMIGQLFDEQSLSIDIEGTGLTLEKFTTFFYKAFLGCLARKG